tara:strand:+ start:4693 stop:5685 length:993 start_codon:yes stop_codon:yes gene_type:complete
MSNIYYNNPDDFVQGDVIRPGDVDGEFDAIETGCDLIEVNTNRALTVPAGETIEITQNAAARVNKIMAFGAAGLPDLGRSLTAFDADVVQVAADKVSTNADVVLTHADVVLTNADVVSAEADKVQTGLDRTAVAADLVATNQDTIDTAADVVSSNAAIATTAANVVLSEADKVQTALDRVATGNDRTAVAVDLVATNQDTVDTAADVVLAEAAKVAAVAAKVAAEAALDNFDDKYLGAKATDPTTDNDGNALVTGTQYFNTTINKLKVYNGSAWQAIQDGIASLAQDATPQLGGNLDLNNFDIPVSPTQQAALNAAQSTSIGLSIVFGGF